MSAIAPEKAADEYPQPHWVASGAFLMLLPLFLTTQSALAYTLMRGWIWLSIPLMLLLSHWMHGFLIGFHEASHGLLRKNRRLNEVDGVLLGILSFMSFTLYRAAHQTHHMHIGTEKDEELWPFVNPRISRGKRVLAAMLELNFGLFFTPYLFFRAFLRKDSPIRAAKVRRRIWKEVILMTVVWIAIIAAVALTHTWYYFLWLYFMPAMIAGNLQSWRKYIEHVGLTGRTEKSATRSIIDDTWGGRLFSLTLLHEPFHGVHHIHAGLTHAELPARRSSLDPTHPDELPPFQSYRHAMWHLLGELRDPKVGAQWRGVEVEEAVETGAVSQRA